MFISMHGLVRVLGFVLTGFVSAMDPLQPPCLWLTRMLETTCFPFWGNLQVDT